MSVSLITVQAFALVAVIMAPGAAPVPPKSTGLATPPTRQSPFTSRPVAEPTDPVERLYQRARRFKAEATFLGPTETGLRYLGICDTILHHTVALCADHYGAHLLWGESLYLQAEVSTAPESRLKLVAAGDEKFRAAEKCPGVTWQLYGT